MYRIRLHGRGGQGIKTAGRILGTAFFRAGFEVQDAPRYGAERRGAPLFAGVRAGREAIRERGAIRQPDLVVVVDDTLVRVPAAGVLQGLGERSTLLILGPDSAELWRSRLGLPGRILVLPAASAEHGHDARLGTMCAGAAARLVGVVSRDQLAEACREELAELAPPALEASCDAAFAGWQAMEPFAGCVKPGAPLSARDYTPPDWVDLRLDPVSLAAPDVRAEATSVQNETGLWRSLRPQIDLDLCRRCSWICSTLCPDGAIHASAEHAPEIDLASCKGCLVCVAVCPSHAIRVVPEHPGAGTGGARAAEETRT